MIENEIQGIIDKKAVWRMNLYGSAIMSHLPELPQDIADTLIKDLATANDGHLSKEDRI